MLILELKLTETKEGQLHAEFQDWNCERDWMVYTKVVEQVTADELMVHIRKYTRKGSVYYKVVLIETFIITTSPPKNSDFPSEPY
jgi:hypothetical protein